MPLSCQPTAAVWLCPWQCCAGGIPHWSRLLGEITHLPVQAGQGLLFTCLILSALILGVDKISQWLQEELPGAFALQENLTAAQGQPKLTQLCLFWEGPSCPGGCSHLLLALQWTDSAVETSRKLLVLLFCLVLSQFFPGLSPHKSSLQGWISLGRQRGRVSRCLGSQGERRDCKGHDINVV